MAITATLNAINNNTIGGKQFVNAGSIEVWNIAMDNSYPTGGEAWEPYCGKENVLAVLFNNDAGYTLKYDATNGKIMAYWCDYDAVADGALIQVANTTDLSALTGVVAVVFGKG